MFTQDTDKNQDHPWKTRVCGPPVTEVVSVRSPEPTSLHYHAHLREQPRGTTYAQASLKMIQISFSRAQIFLGCRLLHPVTSWTPPPE